MHSSPLLNPTTVGGTMGLCDVSSGRIIGGDDDGDATGDGVDAEGGDAGDVANASPGLDASPNRAVFLHIFRLAKRTALTERPGVLSRVVSLEVLFNMTVDGMIEG